LAQTTVWPLKQRQEPVVRLNSWLNTGRAANIAGTSEPIYGSSAIQSVAKQAETTPWTEQKKEDLKWTVMDSTNVETQTFYFMADSGRMAMVQVIYSNVM
jgi:hypothetical protein